MPIDPGQLTSDPSFLSAHPDDQIKYVSTFDPDFAKASRVDQLGYLGHITGKSDVGTALATVPRPKINMQEQPLSTFEKGLVPSAEPQNDALQKAGDQVEDTAANLHLGAIKGLGSTVNTVSKGISKVAPSLVRPQDTAGVEEIEKPTNTAQKIGKGAEQVGEFMLAPETELGEAISKVPLLAKAAKASPVVGGAIPKVLAGAATGGAMNALHGGDAAEGAGIGGGMAALGAAAKPAADAIADYVPQRLYNAIARTSPKGFNYGRNPGQGMADEGLIAGSQGSMLDKVGDRLKATGDMIGQHLADPTVNKPVVNISKAITDPIDQMEAAAIKHSNLDLADRLKDLRDRLTTDYARDPVSQKLLPTGAKKLDKLTPAEANEIKQTLGEMTRWTGDPKVDQLSPAIQQAYRGINNQIESAAPGIKDINQRYGELKSAQESLDHKIRLGEKYNPLGSLTDILSGLHWGAGGYVGSKLARSTPVMSSVAQAARKAPASIDTLRRAATGVAVSGDNQ